MGRRVARVHLVQLGGLRWSDSGGSYEVVDLEKVPGRPLTCIVECDQGDYIEMEPLEVWRKAAGALVDVEEVAQSPSTAPGDWIGIPDRERRRCIKRARDIAEALTGHPDGHVATFRCPPGVELNPMYDPALHPSLDERLRAKAKELRRRGDEKGVTVRSLYEQRDRLLQPGGARNLVHGRYGIRTGAATRIPQSVQEAAEAFGQDRVNREKVSKENLVALFRLEHRHSDLLENVAHRVVAEAVHAVALKYHLYKNTPTKRSKAVPDPDSDGIWIANAPFESVQIDSTPLNLFALDQYGRILNTIHLLTAVDPCVSKYRALVLVPGNIPYNAATVKALLWATVVGNFLADDDSPIGSSPVLARHVGMAISDRGSQYNSIQALGMNAGFELHSMVLPPGRGDLKPHVESRYNFAASVAQLLPGAKGANIMERGKNPAGFPLLKMDALLTVLRLLVEGFLHNKPTLRNGSPDYPSLTLSPNEAEEQYFRTVGSLELDHNPYRALELLKVEPRVIGDRGVYVDYRYFWDSANPELHALREAMYRRGKDRKVAVYIDEYRPHAVIVRGLNGRPIVVPELGRTDALPVLADYTDRDRRQQVLAATTRDRSPADLKLEILALAHDLAEQPPKGKVSASSRRAAAPPESAVVEEQDLSGYAEVLAEMSGG